MADPAAPPRIAELDPQALAGLRALDPGNKNRLLQRVVQAFEASAARLVPQLHTALDAGEAAGVQLVAHTLKSSSASVGALELVRLANEVEGLARTGRVGELAPPATALAGELDAVLHALRRLPEVVAGPR